MVNERGGIVMNSKFIYRSVVSWSGVNSLQYSRLILRHYIVTKWIYKYKHPWSLKGFPFPMPIFILSWYVSVPSIDCRALIVLLFIWPCKSLRCYNIHRSVGGEHRFVGVEPWWRYIKEFELNTHAQCKELTLTPCSMFELSLQLVLDISWLSKWACGYWWPRNGISQ